MFLYLGGEAAVEVVLPWVVEAVADAHFLCRSIPHAAQLVVEVQPLAEVVVCESGAVEGVSLVVLACVVPWNQATHLLHLHLHQIHHLLDNLE